LKLLLKIERNSWASISAIKTLLPNLNIIVESQRFGETATILFHLVNSFSSLVE
jgi:hypothetical protein